MRPDLMSFTVADWMQAKTEMNTSSFKKLVRVARAGGIVLPAGIAPVRNPRITFESVGDTAEFMRIQDVESVERFNSQVSAWADKVEAQLKASAQTSFGHRKQDSALFPHLADSIAANMHKDKNYKMEIRSVGFSLARHGVFMHHGAGSGYGGFVGSKWTDAYGTLKSTAPDSIGKMDTGNRKAVHWFNDVIERNIEELVGIVADYTLDMTVNLNSILIG